MRSGFNFSLSSLMLVVSCAAICASIGAAEPALGIACGILAVPALIRTAQLVRRESAQQPRGLSPATRAFIFFESVVVIGWAVILSAIVGWGFAAAGLALGTAICVPLTQDAFEVGVWLGMGFGGVAAMSMLIIVLRGFWSKRQF
jgi:hypothetical protein